MQENTSFSIISEARLQGIEFCLKELKEILISKNETDFQNQWIESKQVPKLLKICPKTWQNYRDKRIIPFSKFRGKIFVKKSDIEDFLQKHYVSGN